MTTIKCEIRSQYGMTRYYPLNDAAEALAEIAGTQTITDDVLVRAKTRLGLDVELVYPAPKLAEVIDFPVGGVRPRQR